MNLLGSTIYDPAGAVSKATSSLLAMTALDTSNLRLAITVPAHGKVLFRLKCTVTGATTLPTLLLGVLNGATVLGRLTPQIFTGTQNATTQGAYAEAEFIATGLAAGAMNVDAAYAVQVVVASTNIKYGGPNNNSGANAWGGFVFEAWDPQPAPTNFTSLSIDANGRVDVIKVAGTTQTAKDIGGAVPAAAAGASGGLLISGSNAGTTTLGALTVTGATTHTGNVVLSDGLTISAPSTTNRAGVTITGNGTGAAVSATGGGTGQGFLIAGGGTSGDGIKVTTTSGHGLNLAPVGSSMHGILATGGNGGTSDGIKAAAGTGGVDFRANMTGNITGTLATLTTYTGNTPQTGDSFARLGAPAGASVSADVAAVKAVLPAALVSGRIDASVGAMAAGTLTATAIAADAITAAKIADGAIDAATFAAGAINAAAIAADAITAAKIADGAIDAATFAAGAITAAAIAADAITDAKVASDVTIASVTGAVGSVTGNVGGNVVGSVGSVTGLTASNLDATISSRLATSSYTAPLDSAGTRAAVGLASANLDTQLTAIDDYIDTEVAAIKAKTDNLPSDPADASDIAGAFSTVNTTLATIAGYIDTEIAAIKAKTDNLPASPAAVGSAMTLTTDERTAIANEVEAQIIDETDSEKVLTAITDKIASVNPSLGNLTLAAIASQVRTELSVELARIDAAITSRLSAGGYTAPDNASITAILLDSGTTLDGKLDAVKLQTDQLAFTVANQLNVNVASVNGVTVNGSGSAGSPWGP